MAVLHKRKMNERQFIEIFRRYDHAAQSSLLTTMSEIFRIRDEKERAKFLNKIKRKSKT